MLFAAAHQTDITNLTISSDERYIWCKSHTPFVPIKRHLIKWLPWGCHRLQCWLAAAYWLNLQTEIK
ncbi:hypothetical protein CHUAL_002733 [Chamberlinius hualienensis]